MLIDARELADGTTVSADLCIVGAGAAGITIARALRGTGLSIAVIESGGFDFEGDTQSLYSGRMVGIDTWAMDVMRLRYFGGTTNHWAGWCMPLLEEDFEERDWIPNSGWPIGLDELRPYYERAQRRVELGEFIYDSVEVANAEGLPLVESSGRLETQLLQFSPPTRFGSRYRQELVDDPDVDVYLYANVLNVALESSEDSLSHLDCATLSGVSFTVEADRYVLACGGLENPRILLASNQQLPEGVANGNGMVGRYFMEHPHYLNSAAWVLQGEPDLSFYRPRAASDILNAPRGRMMGLLGLSRSARAAEGLPHFTLSIGRFDAPEEDTGPIEPGDIHALVAQPGRLTPMARLSIRAEQVPDPDSRVRLGSDTDDFGIPRIELDWQITRDDDFAIRRGVELVGAEIAAAGLGRIWTPTDDEGAIQWQAAPGGHHMGTTRMSADPSEGVVDANCRAHDVDNLYVAGSSVFTTGGSVNPTLTIVALAERLADHLAEIA
ncbi:MAG: GMC family oxidoreductase [Myxococcota bacterium]